MRFGIAAFVCVALAACNGMEAQQARRMRNFEATQRDFDSIARATFKLIDAKHSVETIIVPTSLDPKARKALASVHPIVAQAPGPPNTLPAGYFAVRTFRIEDGEARLEGQLGPVTEVMTEANMPDFGKEYTVAFYIEGGDWVNHDYKVATCSESRHWASVGKSQ